MINDDQVLELFAAANPVPSLDRFDEVEAMRDGTATHPEGSTGMTITKSREGRSTESNRPRLIAAAIAAALVLIVAVPVLLIDRQPSEFAAAAEVAEAFMDTLESFDAEGAGPLLSEDAVVVYLRTFGYDQAQPGSVPGLWEWAAIHDMTYRSNGCRASNRIGDAPTNPPTDGGGFFTCDYQLEDDWTRALGQSQMTGRFRMEVADNQIVWLTEDFPWDEYLDTWGMVVEWVQTHQPDDFDTMFLDGASGARLEPESLTLWREYSPQITAFISEGG